MMFMGWEHHRTLETFQQSGAAPEGRFSMGDATNFLGQIGFRLIWPSLMSPHFRRMLVDRKDN